MLDICEKEVQSENALRDINVDDGDRKDHAKTLYKVLEIGAPTPTIFKSFLQYPFRYMGLRSSFTEDTVDFVADRQTLLDQIKFIQSCKSNISVGNKLVALEQVKAKAPYVYVFVHQTKGDF